MMSKSIGSPIAIRYESSRLGGVRFDEGLRYVDEHYGRKYGIQIGPPEYLLIALQGGRIVGTFGINTPDCSQGLRLPMRYLFDCTTLTHPMPDATSVEFVRWISESREASVRLIEAGAALALNLGKVRAWCEQTPGVHRASRAYGIQFSHVSSIINVSCIEPEYAAYYSAAQPSLYSCAVVQIGQAVCSYRDRSALTMH